MFAVMAEEEKVTWNMRIFESVASKFTALANRNVRGEKSVMATAACLAFIAMTDEERQRWVDVVTLAEGRGLDGTVADAADNLMAELNAPPEQTRDDDTMAENPTLKLGRNLAARNKGKK